MSVNDTFYTMAEAAMQAMQALMAQMGDRLVQVETALNHTRDALDHSRRQN